MTHSYSSAANDYSICICMHGSGVVDRKSCKKTERCTRNSFELHVIVSQECFSTADQTVSGSETPTPSVQRSQLCTVESGTVSVALNVAAAEKESSSNKVRHCVTPGLLRCGCVLCRSKVTITT